MKNIILTIAILASFSYQYAHAQNDHEYINSNTSITIDNSNGNNGDNVKNGLYFGSYSGEYISSNRVGSINKYGLDFTTSFNKRMCITNDGKVGIGTQSPDALFTVKGPGKYILPRAMNYSGPGSQQMAGGMQMQGSQLSLFNDGYVALFENTNG